MTRIAVSGACGRMAGQVLRRAAEDDGLEVVAAIDAPDSPHLGEDIGEVLGIGNIGVKVEGADDLDKILQDTSPDFLVDFTNPEATLKNAETAAANKVGVVVGTTGLTGAQISAIKESIKKNGVVGLISPNFSVCVNLFFKMAAEAAKVLRDYDIEVLDVHHRFKKDAPSGTAKKLAEGILDSIGGDKSDLRYGREGIVGERKPGEVCIHAMRVGGVVGEHTVVFGNMGERMEIKHQAHSRDAFAYGCLRTIKWLAQQGPGMYEMKDALGLE